MSETVSLKTPDNPPEQQNLSQLDVLAKFSSEEIDYAVKGAEAIIDQTTETIQQHLDKYPMDAEIMNQVETYINEYDPTTIDPQDFDRFLRNQVIQAYEYLDQELNSKIQQLMKLIKTKATQDQTKTALDIMTNHDPLNKFPFSLFNELHEQGYQVELKSEQQSAVAEAEHHLTPPETWN
jgi:hypothetical protein